MFIVNVIVVVFVDESDPFSIRAETGLLINLEQILSQTVYVYTPAAGVHRQRLICLFIKKSNFKIFQKVPFVYFH